MSKKKLHPKTQKAVNEYAKILLKCYRAYKKDNSPSFARMYARRATIVKVSGNVYVEIAYRQLCVYPRFPLA